MARFILALLLATTDISAAPPDGVDHVRGRWDGVISDSRVTEQPFTLLLGEVVSETNNPQAGRAAGCMAVGQHAVLSPAGARFVGLGSGKLNLTLFGTAFGQVIKMSGTIETGGSAVADDHAAGLWMMTSEQGSWSATHHDRRHIECPSLEIGGDLRLSGDVYAAVTVHSDDSQSASILLVRLCHFMGFPRDIPSDLN
jgi:hypothetical protein